MEPATAAEIAAITTSVNDFGLQGVSVALAALAGLATAAFGLLDASKVLWGGVSRFGLGHLWKALTPYATVLMTAVGQEQWRVTIRANWINGMAKDQQKAVVGALLKLGLTPATAPEIAEASHVDAKALTAAATKLAAGKELTPADVNVLGRMSVSVETVLDAAFESAEQQYKNASRVLAGVLCILLAVAAEAMMGGNNFLFAVAAGLLAVPMAPVAKDLTSALSAAMRALKASKAL